MFDFMQTESVESKLSAEQAVMESEFVEPTGTVSEANMVPAAEPQAPMRPNQGTMLVDALARQRMWRIPPI
jgi:hypothetical protein